jgi:hypothetical protein
MKPPLDIVAGICQTTISCVYIKFVSQPGRGYLLGVWQRRQKNHPEIRDLYDSKLILAQKLLQQWVATHPADKLPVTFDNWFTQPAFCRFIDQTLHLPYVGTMAESDT